MLDSRISPEITQKPGSKGSTADLGVEFPGLGGAGFASSGAGNVALSTREHYFWAKSEDETWSGGVYLGNTNLGAGLSFAGGLVSITIGGRF